MSSDTVESREIRLASRPNGQPTAENFSLATTTVGPPGDGELLVRNTVMSVEPYMRGRMNAGRSYVPPFEIGGPLSGAAVGTVVESRDPAVPAGATVLHNLGWREHAVVPAAHARVLEPGVPPEMYLSALGTPGFTAWVGLRIIGNVQAGETIFVSAAAGAVGSMAVQLAKRWGLRVVGSASSAEKVAFVRERLGADAAFDYHDHPLTDRLRDAAPDGIDVYFDNVGGDQLEAALDAMRDFGRVIMCGAIAHYNATSPPPGPHNLGNAVRRRLRLQGFIVSDHRNKQDEFLAEVLPLISEGALVLPSTFVEGIANAPEALMSILRPNAHLGKVLVRLA